jgi:hypothetical protein
MPVRGHHHNPACAETGLPTTRSRACPEGRRIPLWASSWPRFWRPMKGPATSLRHTRRQATHQPLVIPTKEESPARHHAGLGGIRCHPAGSPLPHRSCRHASHVAHFFSLNAFVIQGDEHMPLRMPHRCGTLIHRDWMEIVQFGARPAASPQ